MATPTSTLASSEIVAPIDRSMPPIMITAIWPRATTATMLPVGSSVLHEADDKVSGATMRHTTSNAPRASQIVTKRVLNSARPIAACT